MKAVIRPAARHDILSQFLYLIEDGSPGVAERFVTAIEESISKVTENPYIGAPKVFKHPGLRGLRHWPVKGFEVVQIYYLVEKDVLRVIRILHGKRDVSKVLGRA